MSDQQKAASIHRHYHYHYHYDGYDQDHQIGKKSHFRDSMLHGKDQMRSSNLSWKDHINPEVTRLYDEIEQNESSQGDCMPNKSIHYHPKRVLSQLTSQPSKNQSNNVSQSKANLMHQLQIYEQYLRKRNASNLYVPNKTSFINDQINETVNPQRLNEKVLPQKTLEEFMRNKVDSKIFYGQKMYESTTAKDSYSAVKESDLIFPKKQPQFQAQSEIKVSKSESVLRKPKNTTSQILKSCNQQNLCDENQQFSLFQKSTEEERCIKVNQTNFQSVSFILNEQQKINFGSPYFKKYEINEEFIEHYKYELVKQQCEFLRTKFIEHIEATHGVKF